MTVLLSALAFFILLTLLVIIHELGHFLAARRAGVVVEEFGFGLPPRGLVLFKQGGTTFTLNWIPFGGFVRLKGEVPASNDRIDHSPGSFRDASFFSKVLILVAGVGMNFILAIVLFTFGFSYGRWIPTYLTSDQMRTDAERGVVALHVLIEEVQVDGSAFLAGVPAGSLLTSIDGVPVQTSDQVMELQQGKTSVKYELLTGTGFVQAMTATVRLKDGRSGVVVSTLPTAPQRTIVEALALSGRETQMMVVQTVFGIGNLVATLANSGQIPEGVTGIVGIARLTYASVQQGFATYLRLVAIISLSLAVLNILPFPALDGGRLLFVVVEGIVRRPLNRHFESVTNIIGFTVLIGLILIITFYDILRLF